VCGGAAMAPLTLGLGATTFVVFEQLFDRAAGAIAAILFALVAFFFLYGLGFVLKTGGGAQMRDTKRPTPLKDKIEQLLTEARVIIPGAQALLGFQFVVVFVRSFSELPDWVKIAHAVGLGAVALSVILLMTPAALHRIAYKGATNQMFFRAGSALVIGSALPLAIGIAADICVVGFKIAGDRWVALVSGGLALFILVGFWFLYPLWRRRYAVSAGD
jgi:Family of unknown function (DUF6328)